MISIIFLILAGFFNSIMDVIVHKWDISIFSKIKNDKLLQFINPTLSWKNKWKNSDYKQGEKFIGSSTVFVMFTDLWHLCQFFMIIFFILSTIYFTPIMDNNILNIIIHYLAFTLSFNLFYYKIFKIK